MLDTQMPTQRDYVEPKGPVITETVKRIVPGAYGCVRVGEVYGSGRIDIALHRSAEMLPLSAAELRDAIATLTEIADALERSK